MSSTDKPHFLARKFQDLQRSTARGYICPVCSEAFQAEPKLWQHAKSLHPNSLGYTEEAQEADARKQFRQEAIDRAYAVFYFMRTHYHYLHPLHPQAATKRFSRSCASCSLLMSRHFQPEDPAQKQPSYRAYPLKTFIERRRFDAAEFWG